MNFIITKMCRCAIIFALQIGAVLQANATTDPTLTKPLLGSLNQVHIDSNRTVKDMNYFGLSQTSRNAITNNSIVNMVGIGIEESSISYIRSNFTVQMTLQITSYDKNEAVTGTTNKIFIITYDSTTGAKYKSIDYFKFANAFKVDVKIISIDSGSINWPVSKVLKVENQLTATRDYPFNCNLALTGLNDSLFVANNELTAYWLIPSLDVNPGVTEYDLEWAWIDESAIESFKSGNNYVQSLIFDYNATRVTIAGSIYSYNIPLLYDDTGRIFVRVRPVQLKTNGQRIEGKWTWINTSDPNQIQPIISNAALFYPYYGHEDKLNWQASTSFAEDGKRKSVVQYFDGSLRNRQTVTKDNTTNTTVVAESFYDYQGRAVVQVLPAPTINTAIGYAHNFNKAVNESEYPKWVYDKLDAGASICGNAAKPFETSTGTAKYYSANNDLPASDPLRPYIPNATAGNPNEAYAFTETRLSPDGRVASQGGVGITHQLGSSHETKYFYESPAQEELDALFGTDAGVASHYFKNIVRDANGQYSVSYTDMHGRTIATALAGDVPKNADGTPMFDTLASKNTTLFTKQLIDNETNRVIGNSIISSKSIVALKDGLYKFDYSLSPKQLNLLSCTNTPVCYDCLYKLKFTISSDCGNGYNYIDSSYNFTLGQYLNQCNGGNANQGFTKHFEVSLAEGSYIVTKTLTLSSEAQNAYRDVFLANDTCKKFIDFYTQELTALQSTSNCVVTCQSCRAAIGGDLLGFEQKYANELGVNISTLSQTTLHQLEAAYNEASANCDRLCNNNDGLDIVRSTREMMLQDVTPPYGQYAKLNQTTGTNPIQYQDQNYNIFKVNDPANYLNSNYPHPDLDVFSNNLIKPDYLYPVQHSTANPVFAATFNQYLDEYGQNDATINVLSVPAPTPLWFSDNFKNSWANQLLPHHPEYRKLMLSENQLKTTYQFEGLLEKDTTWEQAKTISTSHPYSFITNLVDADPFFSGVGAAYKSKMINGNYNGDQPAAPTNPEILNVDPIVHGIDKYIKPHTISTQNNPCPNAPQWDNDYISMWQLALSVVYCRDKADGDPCVIASYASSPNTKGGCIKNPAYAHPQNNFGEGCTADRDWAWKIFKNLYLAERRKLISAYLNFNAPVFPATFPNNNIPPYQLRFINHANPQSTLNNLGADAGDINAIITSIGNDLDGGLSDAHILEHNQYDAVCTGYANTWITQLKACPQIALRLNNSTYWVDDSTWLVSRLKQICVSGSDDKHFLGSSSLNPNDPDVIINGVHYREFPDVVKEFLATRLAPPNANNITNPYTEECYPWLITVPKPYDRQVAIANSYVLTKPSDCECQRISSLQFEWIHNTVGFTGTFSAYLQYQHGTYISQGQLDTLLALCDGSYQCKMLGKPIMLPPALQCPSSPPPPAPAPNTCINCEYYTGLKNKFFIIFNQHAPFAHPQNQTQVNYNYVFANFANYQTGFSKTWVEYVAFENTCNAVNPTISCGSLDTTLQAFKLTPEYLANPVGITCVQAFVNYFNAHYNVVYTYNYWMGLFTCGQPNVCQEKLTCNTFTTLIDGFYNQNGVQVWKNGNCQSLFVNYVNTQLTSNYTYDQLQAIYNYTCGGGICGGLNICDFPNRFLLTRVYNQFKIDYPHPWNLPNCQQAFVDYFNNYFGLVPAWSFDNVVALYDKGKDICVPSLKDLCNPPYSCTDLQTIREKFLKAHQPIDQLPNCQQAFADFFNQAMGTSYTYLQIVDLYWSICQLQLTVCDVATDCKAIIVFAQKNTIQAISTIICHNNFLALFNAQFGTTYVSWDDLYKLYQGCKFELNPCIGCTGLVASTENLNEFLVGFKKEYPDPATQLGDECQDYFAARFNEKFTSKYSYTDIENYYLTNGITLNICATQCSIVTNFINTFNTQYASLKLPQGAKEDLFAFAYNNTFLQTASDNKTNQALEWTATDKLAASDTKAVTDVKTFTPLVNYPSIQKAVLNCSITNLNLASTTGISVYDPQVLLSLKQVYYLIHPNGMPDDCQKDFQSWFNRVMKTQYEYKELLSLYNNVCGNNAGYICEKAPEAADKEEVSVYVSLAGSMPTSFDLSPMLCGLNNPASMPVIIDDNPCKDIPKIAFHLASDKYELYIDSLRNVFDTAYHNKCMAAKDLESLTLQYQTSEYHYTLYYYDQAGNLVKTVPPAGVDDKHGNTTFLQNVKTARANVLNGQAEASNTVTPTHTLATQYRYNTLNQVIAQQTPDAGISKFYYDRLARLAISQNAKQATANNYSYTLYDDLGRIKEVGQLNNNTTTITQAISQNAADANTANSLAWWINNKPAEQITRTFYDKSYLNGYATLCPLYLCQKNLRNRVSYSAIYNTGLPNGIDDHNTATFYSYDIHGNVDTLLQDYGNSTIATTQNPMNQAGSRFKKIVYNYDLISGKVNTVAYQAGYNDQFFHQYSYDAENRLINVQTSKDKIVWETDARYIYYKHGPLARTTLGQQQVQGIDYAYTVQGWLKGINSTAVGDGIFDIGGDGKINGVNNNIARDAFGFSLNYFNGDYKTIGAVNPFATITLPLGGGSGAVGASLFNGNISSMLVNIPKLYVAGSQDGAMLYGYRYDQLNRLTSMNAFTGLSNATNIFTPISTDNYKEHFSYNPDGSILTLQRNGQNGTIIDNASWNYYAGTHRLEHINDPAGRHGMDAGVQAANNYQYSPIGEMTADQERGITNISWTVYGKVKQQQLADGRTINYTYDANNKRISKTVTGAGGYAEFYVRDASGNTMSIYRKTDSLRQTERNIYGSDVLGINKTIVNMQAPPPPAGSNQSFIANLTEYYLKEHRGNTLATITNSPTQHSSNGTTIDYYTPQIATAQDYSSFGAPLDGRQYGSSLPRYTYNGKELDPETGWQDYGMREYMGGEVPIFTSVDPITSKFPMLTPYQFTSNTPIQAIDLDGLEAFFIHGMGSDNSRWIISDNNKNTLEGTNQLMRITGNVTYNAQFEWGSKFLNWGNGPFNNKMNRHNAAIKLVNYIMTMVDGTQDVTLVGHSHGGNVAIQALPILRAALDAKGFKDVKINLITLSTPVDNSKGSVENPETYGNLINKHIHIFNTSDLIQVAGADAAAAADGVTEKIPLENFKRKYKFSKSQNVELLDVEKLYTHETSTVGRRGEKLTIKSVDGVGAHSVDNEHPEFIKQKIDDGTIPKIK